MANNRIPTNILALKGAYKKDPQRFEARKHEPKDPEGVGDMPDGLNQDEQRAWTQITDDCIPGVLRRADAGAVMLTARLLAKVYDNSIGLGERGQLIKMLGQFGMTPSERSRISLVQEPARNEFEED